MCVYPKHYILLFNGSFYIYWNLPKLSFRLWQYSLFYIKQKHTENKKHCDCPVYNYIPLII